MVNMGPQERVACYGNRLAPLSDVLPPLPQSGRHDPIAVLGNAVANRDNAKKLNKAQRKMDRGRNDKMNNIEEHLKWVRSRKVLTLGAHLQIILICIYRSLSGGLLHRL